MKAHVLNGIDNVAKADGLLKGKRLGLIAGAASVDRNMRHITEIIAERYNLCAMYAPEHGVRGDLQAGVHWGGYIDPKFNVPVYSLFGEDLEHFTPKEATLKGIDVMVFCMQDAGARPFTHLNALAGSMKVCAKMQIPVVVFDRVAPINGVEIAGVICAPDFLRDVPECYTPPNYGLPTRIGLTIGEFACYVNDVEKLSCDLSVIPITGWERSLYADETDLPWVQVGPNLTDTNSIFLFFGTVLFEGVNISEGRGTTKAFEIFGAPWLNTDALVENMEKRELKGFLLRKTFFTPTFNKYAGQLCNAIQIHVTDRNVCEPFRLTLYLLEEIYKLHPNEFEFSHPTHFDWLLGTDTFRTGKQTADELLESQRPRLERFMAIKKKYHLY